MAFKELLGFYALRKLIVSERARKFDAVSRNHALRVAAAFFGVMSIAHTLRLVFGWSVTIADQSIPERVSVVAILVAVYVSYSLWLVNRL